MLVCIFDRIQNPRPPYQLPTAPFARNFARRGALKRITELNMMDSPPCRLGCYKPMVGTKRYLRYRVFAY
jgi:hypothetical protein